MVSFSFKEVIDRFIWPYNGIIHLVELSSVEDLIKFIVPGLHDDNPSIQANKWIADGQIIRYKRWINFRIKTKVENLKMFHVIYKLVRGKFKIRFFNPLMLFKEMKYDLCLIWTLPENNYAFDF
jgi:RecG-like helicase